MNANRRTVLSAVLLTAILVCGSGMVLADGGGATAVKVDAVVGPQSVRFEAKAGGAFDYTTYRPSDKLFVVDFAGVVSPSSGGAQVLKSPLASSYRLVQYRSGDRSIVRLEILLRSALEPRVERLAPNQISIVLEEKSQASAQRPSPPAVAEKAQTAKWGNAIEKVEVAKVDRQTEVRIQGNGRLSYETIRLLSPDRLVLDFSGAKLRLNSKTVPSAYDPVRGVRLGQFRPDVARVVIDLERGAAYSVSATGNGVVVSFGLSAATQESEQAPALKAQAPSEAPTARIVKFEPVPMPAPEAPATKPDASAITLPQTLTGTSASLASPAPAKPVSVPEAPATAAEPPRAPPPMPVARPAQEGKYSGEPISVNLKDVDLKDFFRLIHEISGLNVVLDPSVRGSLTIVLDEVPWDQALDLVLKNNNLDKQLEGNVLRIATRDTMKREAEAQRDLAKAQAEAVEQVTTTRVLSYAKAASLRDTLKRFLSSRGEILADERSNTLIIRDIPSTLPAIDTLIAQLDKKSQQVEIEARVVAATRSFAREIGTQFGFATSATGGRTVWGGIVGNPGFVSPVQRGSGLPTPPLVASGTNSIPLNTNLGASGPTSGVTFAHSSPNLALDFIISAAENRGVGKLLSKPKVITQNNVQGRVKQGTKIPVQTTINQTVSVQFVDAVLQLQVTPQITAEGTVFMEVLVENTAIDPGIERVNDIPALTTQEANTTVLVNDGGTIVIGGVIITNQRTAIAQVPLLGSVPLIGHLFKRTTVSTDSQELLFFITPRIIPN